MAARSKPKCMSTMAARSKPKHVFIFFGSSVGIGQTLTETVPRDPEATVFFEVVEGPMEGQLIACKRKQFNCSIQVMWKPDRKGVYRQVHVENRICQTCGTEQPWSVCGTTKMKRCTCKQVYYCSQECQKKDWKAHKAQYH